MSPRYEWTPPNRNTEDPDRPALPGMPELKAPRITPHHPQYGRAHSSEVWGSLAHPDLTEHNPFLNDPQEKEEEHGEQPGQLWRQESGGYHDRYEDYDNVPEADPDKVERRVQRAIGKALPAIAISHHALGKVLDSGRLKSQFETYTSGGSLAPESRQDVEHKMFGYPHELPHHARPIYGYLTHNPAAQHPGARGYGEHTLILHRPRIWHRTSAFIGDSLNNQHDGHSAHPVQDFHLSGFPQHANPKEWRLDQRDHDSDIPYTEAQYHGGVGLRDIHYAVLHKTHGWAAIHDRDGTAKHEELKDKLDQHKIPWVEMEQGKPVRWEHHLGRLMRDAQMGAHMNESQSRVVGQQGPGRYLIDLGYDNEHGHRQAQVADTTTGHLHPPQSKDSILARGYWDEPDFHVEVEHVLPLVTPVSRS